MSWLELGQGIRNLAAEVKNVLQEREVRIRLRRWVVPGAVLSAVFTGLMDAASAKPGILLVLILLSGRSRGSDQRCEVRFGNSGCR